MSNPTSSAPAGRPGKQGLYDPWFEHDACGVGFIADMKGRKSHKMVADGMQILRNLDHRGASGAEINTGDGAGILIQVPHKFFAEGCKASLRFTLPEAGAYGVGLIFLPRNATVRGTAKGRPPRGGRPSETTDAGGQALFGALTFSGSAFLALATSDANVLGSFTASSASMRRSTCTPARPRPWMKRL